MATGARLGLLSTSSAASCRPRATTNFEKEARVQSSVDAHPFEYEPPFWSLGDRYVVTLDFVDDDTMRRELGALGVGELASWKIGVRRVQTSMGPLSASVFGQMLSISLGAEDPYEFLSEADHTQAASLGAFMRARGWEAHVVLPIGAALESNPVHFDSGAHAVVADERHRFDERDRASPIVVVGEATAIGFRASFLTETAGSGAPAASARRRHRRGVDTPEITREARCFDVVDGRRLDLDDLRMGMVGRAILGVGRRSDGLFGSVVQELAVVVSPRNADEMARLHRVCVEFDIAPLASLSAERFAALHALDRTDDSKAPGRPSPSVGLAAAVLTSRHALSLGRFGDRARLVGAVLRRLRVIGLRTLFHARQAVLSEADNIESLFFVLVSAVDQGLAEVGDERRMLPVFFFGEPTPTYALLSVAECDRLVREGLVGDARRGI